MKEVSVYTREASLKSALLAVLPHLEQCDECGRPARWHSKSHTYRRCGAEGCNRGVPGGVIRVEYPYTEALDSALKWLPCVSPSTPERQPK